MLPGSITKGTAGKGYIQLYPDTDGLDGFCKIRESVNMEEITNTKEISNT